MKPQIYFAIMQLVALGAHAGVSLWIARRLVPARMQWLRWALVAELVIDGLVLPALSARAGIVPPILGAIFGAAAVWNFAVLSTAPLLAIVELVAWIARRSAPSPAHQTPQITADSTSINRREALVRVAGGASFAATTVPLAWGAVHTRFDVETTEIPIRIARLPRVLDGFTLVQISDVHVGAYLGERPLGVAEETIAAMRPDLIVMTGDLVQHRAVYAPMGAAWLARLHGRARHGLVMIPGNHEYYAGIDRVLGAVRRAGVDVLVNEGRRIARADGGGFSLVGVDDFAGDSRPNGGPRPGRALADVPAEMARVLLCHQPTFHPEAAAFGFDLMLSGHTHGGQIAPLGPIFVGLVHRTVAGLAVLGDTRLYVNRGFGTSGPPTRVSIRPEITKIVLVAG